MSNGLGSDEIGKGLGCWPGNKVHSAQNQLWVWWCLN